MCSKQTRLSNALRRTAGRGALTAIAHIHRALWVTAIVVLGLSCASEYLTDSPYEPLTMDAIRCFSELRKAGKLPGITRDWQRLESDPFPAAAKRVSYPVSVVLHVWMDGDQLPYGYAFTKETKVSEWRLVKAWKERPNSEREDLKIE